MGRAGDKSGHRDTIESHLTNYTLGVNFEALVLGAGAVNGTGNATHNIIEGNDAANQLIGGAGNGILSGGAGADTLKGGADTDFLEGGLGADVIQGDAGLDQIIYGALVMQLTSPRSAGTSSSASSRWRTTSALDNCCSASD